MRQVTIYGITSHTAHAGPYVEMYRMNPMERMFPIGVDDALVVDQVAAQRLRLQVHTIRRVSRIPGVRQAEPGLLPPFEETYVAIEPELEHLLTLPFKARLDEAERQARDAGALRQRLRVLNALPWYRRVWVALRRAA
jgi:hypothetical protein